MKYQFIERHASQFPVTVLCDALSIKPGSYHAYKRRSPSRRRISDEQLLVKIKASHKASRKVYGSPRITDDLKGQGINPQRVIAVGMGEAYPVADNGTDAGRQANRRVEITMVPVTSS